MPAYTTTELEGELRQSEIISGLIQYTYDPLAGVAIETRHSYAILLTQDCDLLRDYANRESGRPTVLNGVLLFELQTEEETRLPGADIRRRVQRHGEERYHLLENVPADLDLLSVGIPRLIIDFRRYFTIPPDEIYRQCALHEPESASRRCRLEMPFREHLQSRVAFYLQRVALPDEEAVAAVAVADPGRNDG